MEIIPAIDLRNGKCVRLTQGQFSQTETYSGDPISYAAKFKEAGATRIHMVDLDGARTGMPNTENLGVVRQVIRRTGLPVQLGGGIRSAEIIERMLNVGVDRVVLGTSAIQDPSLASSAFMQYGEKVAVGIDARDGRVAISGWQAETEVSAVEFAQRMQSAGAKRIIFTDIARDGMLQGPNVAALLEILASVSIPVIASGGVSGIEDVRALAGVHHANLEAAIVGKAIYAGKIDLAEAVRVARNG